MHIGRAIIVVMIMTGRYSSEESNPKGKQPLTYLMSAQGNQEVVK